MLSSVCETPLLPGGSGRQSLTRIAAFMSEFDVFTIEITKSYTKVEWSEDLRTVLKRAGAENKVQVFLFSDTQLKEESFLEDINNILNTGEVPNLFPKDEIMQACAPTRPHRGA
jgi:dynein heavy chain